jgi:CSLREA domain-containing protein/uncharacterized repeat protein (TIGR01451 family)
MAMTLTYDQSTTHQQKEFDLRRAFTPSGWAEMMTKSRWATVFGTAFKMPAGRVPTTITVTTTADTVALDGECSLREAIMAANTDTAVNECLAGAGPDTIVFSLGLGTPTIDLTSPLPDVTESLSIFGDTGSSTRVRLNGAGAGAGANGLRFTAPTCNVTGLVISNFSGTGISFEGNGEYVLQNCRIGTDAAGTVAQGNNIGIFTSASTVLIGTDGDGTNDAAEGNLISGNASSGILLQGGASSVIIAGNFIGTNAAGTASLPNGVGIQIGQDVVGTRVGTDGDGTSDALETNVISGNTGAGITISTDAAVNNVVAGNFIGTNAAGTAAIPNTTEGVLINGAHNNTIGGTGAKGNVISGNGGAGVQITGAGGSGNQVLRNLIGLNAAGTAGIANGGDGVFVNNASNNSIGLIDLGNTIAFNALRGVRVEGGTGNAILDNSIFSNTGLGIDLDGDGVTPNDAGDTDTGANNLQNFPVITQITSSGMLDGTFDSDPTESAYPVTVALFANATCDASGNGEGETAFARFSVASPGNFSMIITPIPGKPFVTATATDSNNNTSEFSACVRVNTAPTITAVGGTQPMGTVASNVQIATATDPDQPLNTLAVTVNGASSATVNGVTISNITADSAGVVRADIVVGCSSASSATFTLAVTDSMGETGTAMLPITVVANPPPTLGSYPSTTVTVNTGTAVTPSAAPTDNGTVASLTASAPAFTGTFAGNPATGVITITNAGPVGNYTVTVTATDNCGTQATTTFPLQVTLTGIADLAVTNAGPATAVAGANATFNITVTNSSPSPATTVTLTDAVPTNTTFQAFTSPAGWTCTTPVAGGSGTITCNIATLAASTTANFALTVRVNSIVACDTAISNTASVQSVPADPTPANNTSTAAVLAKTQSDLSVNVTAPATAVPDNSASYTVTVTNNGPSVSANTQLNNALPAAFSAEAINPTVGSCTGVGTNSVNCNLGTLAVGATVTVTIQAHVPETCQPTTAINTASVSGGNCLGDPVAANNSQSKTTTVLLGNLGAGTCVPATSAISTDKPGSILFQGLALSGATAGGSGDSNQNNTQMNLTNVHPTLGVVMHLFFIDGATCSVADSFICLTANQTTSFLMSDFDPGTMGYMMMIAVDGPPGFAGGHNTGCPISFNYIIGNARIKLTASPRRDADLASESCASGFGSPAPTCDPNQPFAELHFDGSPTGYNQLPRVLALDSVGSRADGNDTLLFLGRIDGNWATGLQPIGPIFGLLYNDTEANASFSFNIGSCLFRQSLSNNFPRTTPRFEQFIPAGRSGWLKLWAANEVALVGAALTRNDNAQTSAGAFEGGHNLHILRLLPNAVITVPVFPPSC